MLAITLLISVRYHASYPPFIAVVVNDTKTSKSELHEYYAKKYKGASQVRYETEPLPAGGGFKSKVICGDGLQAEGCGQSKAAAEQKAAQNVLKKLGK